jgi:VPDSG-CTERM motif
MKKLITVVIAIVAFSAMAGVAQAAQFVHTPDAGSTSALMGIALVGLAAVRRFVR